MRYLASSQPKYIRIAGKARAQGLLQVYITADYMYHIGEPVTIEVIRDGEMIQEIRGSRGAAVTATSFNTATVDDAVLSLADALRSNDIFSNVRVKKNEAGECRGVWADVETAHGYEFHRRESSAMMAVGGTGYRKAVSLTSTTLTYEIEDGERAGGSKVITQQKTVDGDALFDITAPFAYDTRLYPVTMTLSASQKTGNKYKTVALAETDYTVMPATAERYEEIDYAAYTVPGDRDADYSIRWLTTNTQRRYNQGEVVALSSLGAGPLTPYAVFRSASGAFLYEMIPEYRVVTVAGRSDYMMRFDLDAVGELTGEVVDAVEVHLRDYNGKTVTAEPVVYRSRRRCQKPAELFFVNKLGGLDSFADFASYRVESDVADVDTYMVNQMEDWETLGAGGIACYEMVHTKRNEQQQVLTTYAEDAATCDWLGELQRSKYVFARLDGDGLDTMRFQQVIVDGMGITTRSRERSSEIEVKLHTFASNLKF